MLPTFVIGLREGLEAALIVGIIAAFLRQQGRKDLMTWVSVGVLAAVGICVAGGFGLKAAINELPQKQQEGLETVIAAVAVCMVTYMVVWMRRHSRDLKGQLEGLASDAMAGGRNVGRAMVAMAFLAVFREGFETVFFALAIFDNPKINTASATIGLLLGIAVACLLGYGIYRGGVRINLSKFFRGTGVVLVLVAAGLVVNALHTAHEAGWLDAGQGRTVDLSWLVAPGTVRESLLTGMLGLQPFPVTIEVVGWLVYLIPVGLYVAWPPGRQVPLRSLGIAGAVTTVVAGVGALLCVTLAPSAPAERPGLTAGSITAVVTARTPGEATLRTTGLGTGTLRLASQGDAQHAGRKTELFTASTRIPITGRPASLTLGQLAAINGGRLPIGLGNVGGGALPAAYSGTLSTQVWLDTRTDRVLDLVQRRTITVQVTSGSIVVAPDNPVSSTTVALPRTAVAGAGAAAASAADDLDARSTLHTGAIWLLVLAVAGLLTAVGCALRRRPGNQAAEPTAVPRLAHTAS